MEKQTVKKLIEIPAELYRRFRASQLRRESNSDSEGFRTAIRKSIDSEPQSQAKSSKATA